MEALNVEVENNSKPTSKCSSWYYKKETITPQNSFVQNVMSQLKCTALKNWMSRDKTPLPPQNSFEANITKTECQPLNHTNQTKKRKISVVYSPRGRQAFGEDSKIPFKFGVNSAMLEPVDQLPEILNKLERRRRAPVVFPVFNTTYKQGFSPDHELSLSEITHLDIKPVKKERRSQITSLRRSLNC